MSKRIPADWLFPDGQVVIPIPGMALNRSDRVTDAIAEDHRRRLKEARANLDWTNETIAIVFGQSKRAVINWLSHDIAPPLRVVAAIEALVKDPITAHRLNCLLAEWMARVGPARKKGRLRTGAARKRVLVPGWEREQVFGRTNPDWDNKPYLWTDADGVPFDGAAQVRLKKAAENAAMIEPFWQCEMEKRRRADPEAWPILPGEDGMAYTTDANGLTTPDPRIAELTGYNKPMKPWIDARQKKAAR